MTTAELHRECAERCMASAEVLQDKARVHKGLPEESAYLGQAAFELKQANWHLEKAAEIELDEREQCTVEPNAVERGKAILENSGFPAIYAAPHTMYHLTVTDTRLSVPHVTRFVWTDERDRAAMLRYFRTGIRSDYYQCKAWETPSTPLTRKRYRPLYLSTARYNVIRPWRRYRSIENQVALRRLDAAGK